MQIYLAWSGDMSRCLAQAFNEWLPLVLQNAKPFFSPDDIQKGTRWSGELASRLRDYSYGLFFVTADSLNSRWMHFEAGALSKAIDEVRVVPLLFGVPKGRLEFPMAQFQAVEFLEDEIKALVSDLNDLMPTPLNIERLNATFTAFWPQLVTSVDLCLKMPKVNKAPALDKDQVLEDILVLSREIAQSVNQPKFGFPTKELWPYKQDDPVMHKDHGLCRVLRCRALDDGDWLVDVRTASNKTKYVFHSSKLLSKIDITASRLTPDEYDPFADE